MIRLFEYVKGILLRVTNYDSATHDKEGAIYVENDGGNKIKAYLDSAKREMLSEDQVQNVSNKVIDADQNTITNIENIHTTIAKGLRNASRNLFEVSRHWIRNM